MSTQRTLFGTDGIRGLANTYPIRSDIMEKTARAVFDVCGRQGCRILIAKDTRRSCDMIESALAAGFTSCGADVILAGVAPTPAVPIVAKQLDAHIAVMISASHNPFHDNGIKIFLAGGSKLNNAEEQSISERILDDSFCGRTCSETIGTITMYPDAVSDYVAFLRKTLPDHCSLNNTHIVFDGANGAGHHAGPDIFRDLGARVTVLACDPDGININAACGSTAPEMMTASVKQHKADIGIALDGDGDRVIFCDQHGVLSCGDRVVTALAIDMAEQGHLQDNTAVLTRISNLAAEDHLKHAGITLLRSDVGDRYVTALMREKNCNLGGEKSGHIILSDYASTGDGLLTALHVLRIMKTSGKQADDILHPFVPYPQIERNIPCGDRTIFTADACRMLAEHINGTLTCSGMTVIRPSGTEPLVRIMIQGSDAEAIRASCDIAETMLLSFMQDGVIAV